MGMLTTFFGISREIRDQELPIVFWTKLYCSEISKKQFPDYQITEERLNGLAVCGSTAQDFIKQDILFCVILNLITQESGNQKKQLRATFPAAIL
ncbi:hypothetical protein T07_4632 [Trichinella nelsoni]|uniref:Uncharacterized protein n=1 Tax=Trichinella nelsoni TaxID=6336 RepID=A0A0V0S9Q3_9BILA|nr:hypothetical protein T07_4632 [Trichinella nelsoni]